MFSKGHSVIKTIDHSKYFEVKVVPALSDNYMFLIIDRYKKEAAVVDPVEPYKIKEVIENDADRPKLKLALVTHHHRENAGGNKDLAILYPDVEIVSGDERTEGTTKLVKDQQILKIGNITICCIRTPCHTTGHFCYYVTGCHNEAPALFTGDTLYIAGCGKFFEGTAMDMFLNMERFSRLPIPTRVYCAKEYTVANFKFAIMENPQDTNLDDKLDWAKKARMNAIPTVPSTIEEELRFNPFMRATTADQIADLRSRRNRFRSKQERKSSSSDSSSIDCRSGATSASSGIVSWAESLY